MNNSGFNVTIKSNPVRKLRVIFDTEMTMSEQVASVLKSANYHIVTIGKARRSLTRDATEVIIISLVTFHLGHCNRLLVGISQKLQKKSSECAAYISQTDFRKMQF